MRRCVAMTALSVLTLVVGGCGAGGPLGPIDGQEVNITLAVSGGLVGYSYSFEIDGGDGEVRGVSCDSFCEFEAGELIVAVSDEQVSDLARRLEVAQVFGNDGDFGDECCDQIHYDLTYEHNGRTARVRGTGQTLPSELAMAIGHVATLATGRVPILIAPEIIEEDWPRDAYTLDVVTVNGLELTASVAYSGGCRSHRMDLIAWGGWMESAPVRIRALLSHDAENDPCDAVVTESRVFDLSALARAYQDVYGASAAGPRTVILLLSDPSSGGSTRTLEITF